MACTTLRRGSRASEVRVLQRALNWHGPTALARLAADGDFGPLTAGRVREFQGQKGLTQDAVVGNRTHSRLCPVWDDIIHLLEHEVGFIRFSYAGHHITPGSLANIGGLIRQYRIDICCQPGLQLRYYPVSNRIELSWITVLSPRDKASVIHEACHAVSDVQRARIWVPTAEAIAFVAQALFLLHHGQPPRPGLDAQARNISNQARAIARTIRRGGAPTTTQWQQLEAVILAHRDYRNKGRFRQFDGVL